MSLDELTYQLGEASVYAMAILCVIAVSYLRKPNEGLPFLFCTWALILFVPVLLLYFGVWLGELL